MRSQATVVGTRVEPCPRALARKGVVAAIAALLWVCGPLLAASCDGSPAEEESESQVTTLPPSPPICNKDPAELLEFVDYTSAACTGDVCLPACGDGQVCPAGSQCEDASRKCKPIECSQDPTLCTHDTICNEVVVGTTAKHFCGLPPTCADDSNCPCGSYCDASSRRCRLDCLVSADTGGFGLGCSAPLQCDTRGRCSSPVAVPPQIVTIAASPAALQIPEDAGGHFSTVELTVQITTANPTLGTQPGAAPAVTVTAPRAISALCGTGQSFTAGGCTVAGWTFQLQGSIYVASRVVQVKVADGDTAAQWELKLSSAGVPQPAVVTAFPRAPVPQTGRYVGSVVLEASGVPIPVQATVTAAAIELHDPAHVIAPTGTVLVKRDGSATATSFLAGPGAPQLYKTDIAQFQLTMPAPVTDPVSGQLTGSLTASLATSPANMRTWSFSLTRAADLATAEPCPTGENFDAAVAACIPGAPWDPAAAAAPSFVHARATAWLDAMAPRLSDALLAADGAEPLAERLLCFDSTAPATTTSNGFLNRTKAAGLSGDLQCADPNTPHAWWGVGLVSYPDRVTDATKIAQFDMLAQCVQQIMKPAPQAVASGGLDNPSCVSLARFYPALFSVAGTAPYRFDPLPGGAQFDQRNRLLFMRLLQQWSQLAGFLARNGAQQRGVADLLTQLTPSDAEKPLLSATPNSLSYEALLDAVDTAWTVVLDQRIQQPLLAMPGRAIASPDYRQLKRPLAYWTFSPVDRSAGSVRDIGSAPALTASASCTYSDGNVQGWTVGSTTCAHQAAVPGLDQNLTLGVLVSSSAALSGTSTVIDSDGLVVKHVQSASGRFLQIGHRTASGTTQLFSFPVRRVPNSVFIVRDARARTYKFYDGSNDFEGGYVGETVVRQAQYSDPPAVGSDTVFVGASRTASSDNLKGVLSHLAIWDSALSAAEMTALFGAYGAVSFNAHAAWPQDAAVPAASDPDANEPAAGLPTSLLEGLIPTVGLIEAYVKDAALDNPAACRRGNVDDRLQRATERAARSLRVAYAIQLIAEALHGAAIAGGPVAWEARYGLAVSELAAARNNAIQVLADANHCENPMGVGPREFPLYFGDSRSLVNGTPPPPLLNVIEASATYLIGKAHDANEQAIAALAGARASWVQQYSSGVQQGIADQTADQRVDDIRASFGRELIDLCGIAVDASGQNEITVLNRFLAGNLTPQNCFVSEALACASTPTTALGKAEPTCLRGQIGEALIATNAARQRIERAIIGWSAARATKDAWFRHCAAKQDFEKQTKQMIDAVTADEIEENEESNVMGLMGGVLGTVVGIVSENPVAAFGGFAQFQKSAMALVGSVTERRIREQGTLQKRALDDALLDCWNQADLARIPLDGAEQDITVASSDLQTAFARVRTMQQRVAAVAAEAAAAITREAGRARPRIAFHYWADENLALYQRGLERARRMTYLALRAVEHDLQRSFGLDRDVLAAHHPQQLKAIVDVRLAGELGNGIEKLTPTQHFVVLSLCNDVLRLPEVFHEPDCDTGARSQQRFREILLSPANALYDGGAYVGQALPFTLDPALARIEQRCAENLAQINAHFVADSIAAPLRLQIAKRETFYSRACTTHAGEVGGPNQVGTLRSSNNLLLDGTVPQFGQDRVWTSAQVDALKSGNDGFETDDTPGPNNVPDLAGRGIYGDYRLIVLPSAVDAITSHTNDLRDIKIRLDYVSVADSPASPPPAVSPLAIEMRDGSDAVITAPNSVTATCPGGAPSCQQGSVAQITAAAAAGWRFAEWRGACSGRLASCAVAMAGPRQVFATFVNDAPTAAVSASKLGTGSGGIASGWQGVVAGAEAGGTNLPWQQAVAMTTPLWLFASPAPDSVFSGWSGACTGTGACTVTASAAQSVTASFTIKPLLTTRISVDTDGLAFDGNAFEIRATGASTTMTCGSATPCPSGSPAGCVATCTKPFLPGEAVSLGAALTGPFAFMGWANDCAGTSCGVTMTANHTVTALFKVFNGLAVTAPAHGAIVSTNANVTPAINCGSGQTACTGQYAPGVPVPLIAIPAQAYKLSSWTGAASGCGSSATCTVPFSGATTTISASFVISGACAPGDTQSCSSCAGRRSCETGERTCNANGQWGSCLGSVCAPSNGECP